MNLDQLMRKHFNMTAVELIHVKFMKETNKLLFFIKADEVLKYGALNAFEKDVRQVLEDKHQIETILHYPEAYFSQQTFENDIWPYTLDLIKNKNMNTSTMLSKGKLSKEDFRVSLKFPSAFIHDHLLKNKIDTFLQDYLSRMFKRPMGVSFEIDDAQIDEERLEIEEFLKAETEKRSLEISKNYVATGGTSKSSPQSNFSKSDKKEKVLPENVIYRKPSRVSPWPLKKPMKKKAW